MPDNTSITRDQLSMLFWGAELGGNAKLANHFSYAEKGQSTYSFGVPQFDVGNDDYAQTFLKENGFSAHDIRDLSKQGGLSHAELNTLDAKLQAIPQAKIDQLTNQHLDHLIRNVDTAIDQVRKQNPAAADAISKDPKLQLSIADYENQFGSVGPQLIGFLAGKPEKLPGGTVQACNPPTRDDLVSFVHNTKYGQDPRNARAVESRNERFDEAMGTLKLGTVTKAPNHTPDKAVSALQQGVHGAAVMAIQTDLAKLGYTGGDDKPLKVDGDFGLDTRHVVERFQHDHHLKVDGIAGPTTLKALDHAQAKGVTPGLADPKNPDHTLYEQALTGVRMLDANLGRTSDRHSEQLAAGLVVVAKREGLTKIDNVVLSEDGSRAFAVQGKLDSPLRQIAHVQTAEAVNTPIDKSSAAAQAMAPKSLEPAAAVAAPTHVQPSQAMVP